MIYKRLTIENKYLYLKKYSNFLFNIIDLDFKKNNHQDVYVQKFITSNIKMYLQDIQEIFN